MPDQPHEPHATRILVVDDEDAVRNVLVRALGLWGYSVDAARDGESAIAQFSRSPGAYACVLLDLTMPGIGGEATYQRLKAIDTSLPVLLMSGYAPAEAVARFGAMPPAGFLQKPFDLAKLREVVQTAIGA